MYEFVADRAQEGVIFEKAINFKIKSVHHKVATS